MWHERTCEQCKREFLAKNNDTRFCSPVCNRKWRWLTKKVEQTAYHKNWVQKNRRRVIDLQIHYLHSEMKLHPWRSLVRASKKRAAKVGILHDLTFEWGEKNWSGKCAVTGIPFALPSERYGHKNRHLFPSIDRIDPAAGYVANNCRFVLWAVNVLKSDGTDALMFQLADAISISPVRINGAAGPCVTRIS